MQREEGVGAPSMFTFFPCFPGVSARIGGDRVALQPLLLSQKACQPPLGLVPRHRTPGLTQLLSGFLPRETRLWPSWLGWPKPTSLGVGEGVLGRGGREGGEAFKAPSIAVGYFEQRLLEAGSRRWGSRVAEIESGQRGRLGLGPTT